MSAEEPKVKPSCTGILKKLGGGTFEKLQDRFFILAGSTLSYYACSSEAEANEANQKGTIDVTNAQVIDRGTYKKALCFSIEGENLSKGNKEYFLFASSREDKWRWLSAVMAATGRYTFMSAGTGPLNEQRLASSPLYSLIKGEASNQVCADCDSPHPTWCVLKDPHCAFICIECVGLHRKLWAPNCKEAQLDKWSEEEVARMTAAGGNAKVNEELEFHVPETIKKPTATSPAEVREAYIQAKWNKEFVKGAVSEEPLAPLTDDTPAPKPSAAAAIALGQPPKYIGIMFCMLLRCDNFANDGGVACLTNGFQEVRSMAGKKEGAGTTYNQMLQLGIDTLQRPLYFTFYTKSESIVGTAEVLLKDVAPEALTDAPITVKITGKGVPPEATATLSVTFNQLT